eukprot:CAMPEP_0117755732 /NCGR_PEP_ID=MMETSP0947-20121206/13627_1 /TAXON_ID=44440 /ORGANISM="Chattonella subsalsa, Strain CCMP2191" /LENGTH=310 /DNA_ID=CAMNT_0005575123 /DNA_START=98 /DNA_END=1030 /DNA_ORIENTATION=+
MDAGRMSLAFILVITLFANKVFSYVPSLSRNVIHSNEVLYTTKTLEASGSAPEFDITSMTSASDDEYFSEVKEKELKKLNRIREIQDMCYKTSKTSAFILIKQAQYVDKLMNVNFVLDRSYGREPSIDEWASACETPTLGFERYVSTGLTAKTQLVERNLVLVRKAIRNYIRNNGNLGELSVQELQQEGIFGLMGAIETFDPSETKASLESYATYWIRTSIRLAVSKKNALMRFPIETILELDKLMKARPALVSQLGGPPSDKQLSNYLGWSVAKMRYYSIYLTGSPLDDMETMLEQRSGTEAKLFKAVV